METSVKEKNERVKSAGEQLYFALLWHFFPHGGISDLLFECGVS